MTDRAKNIGSNATCAVPCAVLPFHARTTRHALSSRTQRTSASWRRQNRYSVATSAERKPLERHHIDIDNTAALCARPASETAARAELDRGRQKLSHGEIGEALACFRAGIGAMVGDEIPSLHLALHSGIAACFMRTESWFEAVMAADIAVEAQESSVPGVHSVVLTYGQAAARCGLLSLAESVLSQLSEDFEAAAELAAVRARLAAVEDGSGLEAEASRLQATLQDKRGGAPGVDVSKLIASVQSGCGSAAGRLELRQARREPLQAVVSQAASQRGCACAAAPQQQADVEGLATSCSRRGPFSLSPQGAPRPPSPPAALMAGGLPRR